MTQNHFRLFLTFTFCGIAAAGALWFPGNAPVDHATAADVVARESSSLTIGSKAPELDIENWVQDGNGYFQPVTKFAEGKVYVVEFWATWCGPCVASMPHLAALQDKYRGQDVQVVSISDEPLKTVEEFLKKEAEGAKGEKKTFGEITSAYCLTTDPDRSVYEAFMTASQQQGIPTAFIVGKDGKVEWIGHPMEMDEPLERVVGNAWDRVAFAKIYEAERKFNEVLQRVSTLAGAGKFDEALRVVDREIKGDAPEEIRQRWVSIRPRVKLSAGMIDQEVFDSFNQEMGQNKGNAIGVARVGWSLYQASREQKGLEPLLSSAITALDAEVEGADLQTKPLLFDTLAHLYEATGKLDSAIDVQSKAVEMTEGRTSQRLARYLKELQEQKAAEK